MSGIKNEMTVVMQMVMIMMVILINMLTPPPLPSPFYCDAQWEGVST